MTGLFIVLEGIDGCGKGTQAELLADYLFRTDKRNHVFLTREPTGRSDHGVEVRKILKEESDPYSRGIKMAELFVNDRKKHVENVIAPILSYGGIVVCDRYKHSTLAYQALQGIPLDELIRMHDGLPVPDLTMIFDLPVEEALRRQAADEHRDYREVFEKKEFQERLRQKYLELPNQLVGEHIKIIDARLPVDYLAFREVREAVLPLLHKVA